MGKPYFWLVMAALLVSSGASDAMKHRVVWTAIDFMVATLFFGLFLDELANWMVKKIKG